MRAGADKEYPKFVSFSGIDGAGKSTQIEHLRTRLQEVGLRVRLVAFWDNVARLTRIRETAGHKVFKGEKGVGTPSAPIERRDKNVQSRSMTAVRLFLYLVDAISLRLVVGKALRSDADFIIFDRYAYDEFANLDLCNPAARVYVRLIMKFVPRPHISYFLDADPAQARARKPEYPIEFLHANRASYLALSNLLGGMTVIAPMPVQEVKLEVMKHAMRLLSLEEIQINQAEKRVDGDDPNATARLERQDSRPAAF